jgi:hypothetical protein
LGEPTFWYASWKIASQSVTYASRVFKLKLVFRGGSLIRATPCAKGIEKKSELMIYSSTQAAKQIRKISSGLPKPGCIGISTNTAMSSKAGGKLNS